MKLWTHFKICDGITNEDYSLVSREFSPICSTKSNSYQFLAWSGIGTRKCRAHKFILLCMLCHTQSPVISLKFLGFNRFRTHKKVSSGNCFFLADWNTFKDQSVEKYNQRCFLFILWMRELNVTRTADISSSMYVPT